MKKYYLGIDSGSYATKLVCIDEKDNIVEQLIADTGKSARETARFLVDQLKEKNDFSEDESFRAVSTGKGRSQVMGIDDSVTDITCHALGAHHFSKDAGIVIEIGKNDTKVIKIDKNGAILSFAMNDHLTKGAGNLVELIAAQFKMSPEELSELASKNKEELHVTSVCSESDVAPLIASGKTKEEIALGLYRTIAERTTLISKKIEGVGPFYMAGGVSKNRALIKELEKYLGKNIKVMDQPQFCGALGAALIAKRTEKK